MAWFVILWMKKNECTPTGAAIVRAKTQKEAFLRAWKTDYSLADKHGCGGSFDYRKVSAKEAKKLMLNLANWGERD